MSPRITSLRTIVLAAFALLAVAFPAAASAAATSHGAVVFSQSRTVEGVEEGGLFAVKDGQREPADRRSGRHRTLVLAGRSDDRLRPRRPHLHGPPRRLGRAPPHQRLAPRLAAADLAERQDRPLRAARRRRPAGHALHGADRRRLGEGARRRPAAKRSKRASPPSGKTIVFVRPRRPSANGRTTTSTRCARTAPASLDLTTTARVDEFDPRYFAGGIVFSRGNQSEGAAGYADIYTMKANGTMVKPLVRGVGSAYVEDVSPQGHTLIFRRDRGLWQTKIGPGDGEEGRRTARRLADQLGLLLRRDVPSRR